MASKRISRLFGAVNIGSFRISAMIMGLGDDGELEVLGSGHRASNGIKRGYVTDMAAATYAIRDAVERAEKTAGCAIESVVIGCAGAGLASHNARIETEIGGRRIEDEDIESLLVSARDVIRPDGRMVLHAQPVHYTLDGAHGVANPRALHAERLGVDIHVVLAEGAPLRNLTEAVQNAHLEVGAVVASPLASAMACLSEEERDLGVAMIEFGAQVTVVSVYANGVMAGLRVLPYGSGDISDAIASAFGIRRFQAERLKCVAGSAIASPSDHREMVPIDGPGETPTGPMARGADEHNRISRAQLVSIVTEQLSHWTAMVSDALKQMGFDGRRAGQVVITGGGAELAGLADFLQGALGMPVRRGRPAMIKGLPEAHATPGFASLVGLCLFAAADPIDIRRLAAPHTQSVAPSPMHMVSRLFRALREQF